MFGFFRTARAVVAARWEWFEEKARSPRAVWWLALYAFLDPMLLPVPTEPFLALVALANRGRVVFLTLVVSVSTMLGALSGYGIAALLYEPVAVPLIALLGIESEIASLSTAAASLTFIALFLTALTPIPDPPLIIGAGLIGAPLVPFLAAFFLGRALRFALVLALVLSFGMKALAAIERMTARGMVAVLIILLLIGTLVVSARAGIF